MRRYLVFAATTVALFAQSGPSNLSFEEGHPGEAPVGWFGSTAGYAFKLTAENPKAGKYCAEIDFIGAEEPARSGNLMQSFDGTPYRGKRVRFRAAVKIAPESADDRAQLWFRADLPDGSVGFFENMQDRPIRVRDWQYFDITGNIDDDAKRINIGLMVFGKGKAWIDDVSFEVLGDVPGTPGFDVPPSAAFDKLTEAAKLWAYAKYFHTRVTAPGVDWDQAFMDAAPKILAASDDDAFMSALNGMLAPLHDPLTRAVNPGREKSDDRRVMVVRPGPKDVVVGLTSGDAQEFQRGRQSVIGALASARAVVFDVRGSRASVREFAGTFPIAADAVSPSTAKRVHFGYAPQIPGGYQGYRSVWQIADERVAKTQATSLRPVFVVNSDTIIPDIAVSLQDSGGCAILSEDAISDAQTFMGSRAKTGNLDVRVRTTEFEHADGTNGLTANVVLNKTGDAALEAAIEFARSGNWPAPLGRTRLSRPPAVFTEKTDAKPYRLSNFGCWRRQGSGESSIISILTNTCTARIGTRCSRSFCRGWPPSRMRGSITWLSPKWWHTYTIRIATCRAARSPRREVP